MTMSCAAVFPAGELRKKANSLIKSLDAAARSELSALESPERAAKSIDFWKQYRSYIINYNLGQDVIRNYMEKKAGTDQSLQKKWRIFFDLLSTPRTPSGLK